MNGSMNHYLDMTDSDKEAFQLIQDYLGNLMVMGIGAGISANYEPDDPACRRIVLEVQLSGSSVWPDEWQREVIQRIEEMHKQSHQLWNKGVEIYE